MSSALSKRLDRLEAMLAARIAPPTTWRWLMPGDDNSVAEAGVKLWRWATPSEAVELGLEAPPEPPTRQPHVPARLPGPEPLKLLPPPSTASGDEPAAEASEVDADFERVRVVPEAPRKDEERFHWPILYPRTGSI